MKRYVSIICVFCCFFIFFSFQFPIPLSLKKTSLSLALSSLNEKKAVACSSKAEDSLLYTKEVFLTFDDGPCENNTRRILEILNDNNVKATFFVVGIKGEENSKILKEISDSGMCIGVHTYSHNYKQMYKNLSAYLNDFEACKNVIKNITGKDSAPYIRLPGGSDNLMTSKDNLQSIKKTLKDRGIRYVDWNVSADDAIPSGVSTDSVRKNVINQCREKKLAVVLMHDANNKSFTVEALPDIIKYLKNEGFIFRTFDDLTATEESVMQRIGIINRG